MRVTRSTATCPSVAVFGAVVAGYLGWLVAYERAHSPHDLLTTPPAPAIPPWVFGAFAAPVLLAVWVVSQHVRGRAESH